MKSSVNEKSTYKLEITLKNPKYEMLCEIILFVSY